MKKKQRKIDPLLYAPFGDKDRDGVPNVLDCAPLDPTKHGLWDWVKSKVVTPIYQKVYTPIIKPPLVATRRVAQRTIQQYAPTISYTRAAERRAAVRRYIERKPAKIVKKIKKRIPEKELAKFAIKRAPIGMVSTHLIKQLPQFRKLKPEVVTPRIPTVAPMRMGLLAGAEVVIPVLREKVITPIRRGYEKIKDVGVYSTTFGYVKPSKISRPPIVPSKEPPKFKDILFEPTKVHFRIHGKLYKKGEEIYHRKITEPLGVWIGGEKAKKRVEQEVRISEAVKKVGELERKEWIQPSGEFILPRILKSEVHRTEDEIKKLEKFALDKGWQDVAGRITYPDTVEGKDWVKTYGAKIKEHEKYITPEGYYKEAYLEYTPEAKSYVEAVTSYEKEKAKLGELPKAARTRRFIRGAGEMVAGIPGFVAFTTPRIISETIVAPKAAPSKAVMFGKEFYGFAKVEPYRAAGGLAVMAAIPLARKLPVKPTVSVGRFPAGKGYSFGIEMLRKPSLLKPAAFGEFKPLITIGKGGLKRISVGKPKIRGELFGKEPYAPTTPLESFITARAIPKEALKITEARGVRYYTIKSGVKPKRLEPIIDETLRYHGLSKSTEAVIKTLRKEKADLYGSVVQKVAGREVGEVGLKRVPRDFDVRVKCPELFAKRAVERINLAEGMEAVILKKGKKVVVKSTGEKLFDIHPKEEVPYAMFGEDYLAYGLKGEPIIKTIERIRTTTLSEQATRKLHGAMRITAKPRELISEAGLKIKGRIVPAHKGRIKDIADYYFAEKANIEGLRLKGKLVSAKKADVHLEKWLESWGKDVKKYTKDLYTETVRKEGGAKAWLGTFEEKPFSPSESYKIVSQIKYVTPVSAIPSVIAYRIPSVISEVSVPKPSVIPSVLPLEISTIPTAIPLELPSAIPTRPYVVSKIPSGSRILSSIDSKVTSIFDGYKPKPQKPYISPITGKPYKPKVYKPKVYKPYSYKPYPYKPYIPPSKGEYPFIPFIYVPAPPVTKPHIIPKDKEEIKKFRREPWAAIQTSVKNPILSADKLIKKML